MFFFWGRGVVLLLFNLRVNCKAQVTAIMGTREFGCWVDNVYSAVSVYLMPKTANRNTLNCENSCFFFLCSSYQKKKKSKTEFSVENKAACSKVALPDSKGEKKRGKREGGRKINGNKNEVREKKKKQIKHLSLGIGRRKKKGH